MSDSLRPHESQHARPPCPSPTPGVHSDSHPSSQWCHPAISSSVVPFSSCPQSLPASESFPMSQLFARGGQSTGVSALASFLPKKSQGWPPSEWTGWISLQSKGLSRVFSNTTVQKLLCYLYSLLLLFSHWVMSDSLWPHGPQASLSFPVSPGVCSNSCPLSKWCHPIISSSVVPFSSRFHSFPASGSFPKNWLFLSGGQSIGASVSTSVLSMNTQDWSSEWTGWISLQSKGLSRVFSNTTVQKH